MSQGTWLVSAFAPFGGARTNSSWILAEKLRGRPGIKVLDPLPVSFSNSWPALLNSLDEQIDLKGVLALGQAETRSRLSVECVALNWIDARIADNDGQKPPLGPIRAGHSEILWSSIPWQNLELSEHIERSYSAGTYVCNLLMYELLQWANEKSLPAGFVHIPLLTSQDDVSTPSLVPRMSDSKALAALEKVIAFAQGHTR